MRLVIRAVGRLRAGPERDLVDDYCKRAETVGRGVGLAPVEEVQLDPGRAARASPLAPAPGSVIVALDEGGRQMTSRQFADQLARWRDDARPAAVFVIGGADGLDPSARAAADLVLAFGPQTWPHRLVRAMLAEQLYRAASILAGAPYHREG